MTAHFLPALPLSPPPSTSPLSFFSCLHFALSHCFVFFIRGHISKERAEVYGGDRALEGICALQQWVF